MTREEAIEVIKAYRDKLTNSPSNQLDGDIEALDMAIQALKLVDEHFIEPVEKDVWADAKRALQAENKCNPNDCPHPYGTYETCNECKANGDNVFKMREAKKKIKKLKKKVKRWKMLYLTSIER